MNLDANASSFDRAALRTNIAALAREGVFIGTSSWKYPGWRGMLYEESRYLTRGRFAKSRFERECLAEYAGTFKTVCVDAAYYKFPDVKYIESMVSQVPADFLFAFKVTDQITIKHFPNLPRFGPRAGKPNEFFLNADLFASAFLTPFETFRANVGMFVFEFSRFHPEDYERGSDFLADLDRFLAGLPKGWRYGVEIRNKQFLRPEHFAVLARHGAAHVFNLWSDMPPVGEQMTLPGSWTSPEFAGARFLLKPGRRFEEAVKLFSPYDKLKEPNEPARAAAAGMIVRVVSQKAPKKIFIFVNNRMEGNALETIEAVVEQASKMVSR